MTVRGAILLAAVAALGACSDYEAGVNPWDPAQHQAFLGVAADDGWCRHMRDIRSHVDYGTPLPPVAVRAARLAEVRAEADSERGGDALWPFRKGLICEYIDGAAEEQSEFDWFTAAEFLTQARLAVADETPVERFTPLVPVFDLLKGDEPDTLRPIDLSTPDYCTQIETSGIALTQQRGGLIGRLSARGALMRAPDWLSLAQVAYHRWGKEQSEGHQIEPGGASFGGIPFHCSRFHEVLKKAVAFDVKDNLVFLLPEREDPAASGRLEVTDVDGVRIILDRVFAAAQVDPDGTGGEAIEIFEDDIASSPGLSGARQRLNALAAPKVFRVLFDFNQTMPEPTEPEVAALRRELLSRDPSQPLRIAVSGLSDCVGTVRNNRLIAKARVDSVVERVIHPALLSAGFDEESIAAPDALKRVILGEQRSRSRNSRRCTPDSNNRSVIVVVQ